MLLIVRSIWRKNLSPPLTLNVCNSKWAPCMLPNPGAVTRTQAKVIFNWILYTCTHKSSSHSIQRKVVFPTLPLISDQSKTRKYIRALPPEGGGSAEVLN